MLALPSSRLRYNDFFFQYASHISTIIDKSYACNSSHVFFSGFLPSQTAKHHRENVLSVLRQALDEAKVDPKDIDAVAYTKGKINVFVLFQKYLVLMDTLKMYILSCK